MNNIVVMPNYRTAGEEPLFVKNCKLAWQAWCEKYNYRFLELTTPVADFRDISPQMQKMWTLDILLHNNVQFNQIAQVDYDTLPLPHCDDFFKQSEGAFSAVLDNGFGPALNRSARMVQSNWYPSISINWDNYFNSGFIVYSRTHESVFKAIQEFYSTQREKWCEINKSPDLTDDQTLLNFEVRKQNFKVNLLQRSYNVLDWHCRNFFSSYTDELGRDINAIDSITNCVNIFHLTGDTTFRNAATDFLLRNFF